MARVVMAAVLVLSVTAAAADQRIVRRVVRAPGSGGGGGDSPADIIAAGCSTSQVQAAIDSAVNGNIVEVPSGSCTWSSGVSIVNKAITLRGGGAGVTILDNVPDGTIFISIEEATAGHTRLTKFTFDSSGASHGSSSPSFHVSFVPRSGGRAILSYANTHLFGTGGGINAYRTQVNRGVIHNNQILAEKPPGPGYRNTFSALRCKNSTDLVGWESPSTLGTLDTTGESNLYFENNVVRYLHEGTDFDDACRVVFRYNTFNDSSALSHGWDSSPLGSRQVEIYNNTFTYGDTGPDGIPFNANQLINIRGGGVWVVHNNIIPSVNTSEWGDIAEISIVLYGIRTFQCYNGSYPMYHQQGQGHNGSGYVLDPMYFWNNLQSPGGSATPGPFVVDISDSCGNGRTTSEFVQLNRDYYVGTAKPSYTAYTYPHPLTSTP